MIELDSETDLFGQAIAGSADIDRDALAAALYAQMRDLTLEEFVGYFTNKFEAVVDYANLCAGQKTGQRISLLFNPHRLDTGTKLFKMSVYQKLKKESFYGNLARVVILNRSKGATKDLLYASIGMGIGATSYVQEFPPHVARDLALEYNLSSASRVLDPCAGWGGRMLGFSAVVNSYTCSDPSSRTAAGLRNIYAFIKSFRPQFNATIFELPFEDVCHQNGAFDFAMTSPPYFDTEHYAPGEAANSFNRYATFDQWVKGFYEPLIHRTMSALKPGAVFVINIGSRTYPLNDQLFRIADGRYSVEKQKGKLSASNGLGKEGGEGETFYEVKNPSTYDIVLLDVKNLTLPLAAAVSAPAAPVAECRPESERPLVLEPPQPVTASEPVNRPEPEAVRPEPVKTVSALDFVMSSPVVEIVKPVDIVSEIHDTTLPCALCGTADDILEALKLGGHHALVQDGKLFVSNSLHLDEALRMSVKAHKADLIPYASSWSPPVVETSLAQFLGNMPSTDPTWFAQEPPSLDGIDTIVLNFETNGLDWQKGDLPVGVTVGTLDGSLKRFLPFGYRGDGNLDEAAIKRWAEREIRNKHIINANTGFDIHMGDKWGIDLEGQGNTVADVQLWAALLDDHRKRFAIDVLAKDYLGGIEVDRIDESRMADHAAYEVAPRAEYQVALVAQLHNVMMPLLDKENLQRVRQLEDDVIFATCEMERNGAPLDMELLVQFQTECIAEHDRLLMEVSEEAGFGYDGTPTSKQRLFEKFGIPVSYLEDTGKASFTDEIMSEIDHPVIKKAHFIGQLSSLNSKTFKPYRENVGDDGILWVEFQQLRGETKHGGQRGTVSGRFSAPYVHQVPNAYNHKDVFGDRWFPRRLFRPAIGMRTYAADAEQIEYRIFSHHANNPKVLAAYATDPMMSFHKYMHPLFLAHKPDMNYSSLKNMNFMKIYGGGLVKTALMMKFISAAVAADISAKKSQKTDPRLDEARKVEAIYSAELPEAAPLMRKASHLAMTECDKYCRPTDHLHRQFKHRGYVETILGRRARFPNNFSLHKALNRVIQGTGADIMKTKMVELHRERKTTGFVMRMTVHDEITGDVPDESSAAKVQEILNRQSFPSLRVPILWAGKTGETWADCK